MIPIRDPQFVKLLSFSKKVILNGYRRSLAWVKSQARSFKAIRIFLFKTYSKSKPLIWWKIFNYCPAIKITCRHGHDYFLFSYYGSFLLWEPKIEDSKFVMFSKMFKFWCSSFLFALTEISNSWDFWCEKSGLVSWNFISF